MSCVLRETASATLLRGGTLPQQNFGDSCNTPIGKNGLPKSEVFLITISLTST